MFTGSNDIKGMIYPSFFLEYKQLLSNESKKNSPVMIIENNKDLQLFTNPFNDLIKAFTCFSSLNNFGDIKLENSKIEYPKIYNKNLILPYKFIYRCFLSNFASLICIFKSTSLFR